MEVASQYERDEVKRKWVEEMSAIYRGNAQKFAQMVEKLEHTIFKESSSAMEYHQKLAQIQQATIEQLSQVQKKQQLQQQQRRQQYQPAPQQPPPLPQPPQQHSYPSMAPNPYMQQPAQQQQHMMGHPQQQFPNSSQHAAQRQQMYQKQQQQQQTHLQNPGQGAAPGASQHQQPKPQAITHHASVETSVRAQPYGQQQQQPPQQQQQGELHNPLGFDDFLNTFLDPTPGGGAASASAIPGQPAQQPQYQQQQPQYQQKQQQYQQQPQQPQYQQQQQQQQQQPSQTSKAPGHGGIGMQPPQQQQPGAMSNACPSIPTQPGPAMPQQYGGAAPRPGMPSSSVPMRPQQPTASSMPPGGSRVAPLQQPAGVPQLGRASKSTYGASAPAPSGTLPPNIAQRHEYSAEQLTELYWKYHNELRSTALHVYKQYLEKSLAALNSQRNASADTRDTQRRVDQLQGIVSRLSIQRIDPEAARLDIGQSSIKMLKSWRDYFIHSRKSADASKAQAQPHQQPPPQQQQPQLRAQQQQPQQPQPQQQLPRPAGWQQPVQQGQSPGLQPSLVSMSSATMQQGVMPQQPQQPQHPQQQPQRQPPAAPPQYNTGPQGPAAAIAPGAPAYPGVVQLAGTKAAAPEGAPAPVIPDAALQAGQAARTGAAAVVASVEGSHADTVGVTTPSQGVGESGQKAGAGKLDAGKLNHHHHKHHHRKNHGTHRTSPQGDAALKVDPLQRVLGLLKRTEGDKDDRSPQRSSPAPSAAATANMIAVQQWSSAADECDIPPIPSSILGKRAPVLAPMPVSRCTYVCPLQGPNIEDSTSSTFFEVNSREVHGVWCSATLEDDAISRAKFKRRREILEGHCGDIQAELSPNVQLAVLPDNKECGGQAAMVVECTVSGKLGHGSAVTQGLEKLDEAGCWKKLKVQIPPSYKIPIDFASAAMMASDDEEEEDEATRVAGEDQSMCNGILPLCSQARHPIPIFPSTDHVYDSPLGSSVRVSFQEALQQSGHQQVHGMTPLRSLACLWRDTVSRLEDDIIAAKSMKQDAATAT